MIFGQGVKEPHRSALNETGPPLMEPPFFASRSEYSEPEKTFDKPYGITVRYPMQIHSVRHRGLRRLLEKNDPRGIRPDQADRIRKILAVLIVAENMDQVRGPPGWPPVTT